MGCMSSQPQKLGGDARDKYVTSAVGGLGNSSESAISHSDSVDKEAALEAAAHATGSRDYSSWVELRVACSNLKSADVLSKSDPMVALFARHPDGWKEVSRTEVVGNNESPTFLKAFRILYNFEQVQHFRLEIVDVDKKHDADTIPIYDCNRLGHAEFKLSDVLTSAERRLSLDIQNTTTKSKIHVMAEELSTCRDMITMQISASSLKNVELMSKSDPFLEISAQEENGRWKPVFKTEVKRNNLDPTWSQFTIRATQLNNGDNFRPLLLRVYDYESSGKHCLIGEVEATTSSLMELAGTGSLPLFDPKHKGSGKKHAGALHIKTLAVTQQPTFLDYIQAGAEINFLCGIDYTASNKDPRDPDSLHYLNPSGAHTPYEEAIMGVGQVLQAYAKDNLYHCYGFGCKIPGTTVDHCAPLGPDGTATCKGIEGMVAAYRQALYTRALSGPTLFGPLLKQAATTAAQSSGLRYTVCLILTDGCIHDMQDTVDTIVGASTLPMSIIIVGVGHSPELQHMKVLDSDKKVLMDRNGIAARRDIVQYVNFTDFKNDGEALACELLAELPGQFLEWCKINNFPVRPALSSTISTYQSVSTQQAMITPHPSASPQQALTQHLSIPNPSTSSPPPSLMPHPSVPVY